MARTPFPSCALSSQSERSNDMTTLTPTKDKGATAKPAELLYVDPVGQTSDDALRSQMNIEGMNTAFIADLLSGMLTHERCGTHLYRSVSARSHNPMLKRRYEQLGEQTARHVEILEALITGAGG